MNEQRYILEGWVLYAVIGLPFVAGMALCARKGVLSRLLLLAFATISLAVGFGSVHAALNDQPWVYIPLWFGQYINLLGLPFFIGTIVGTIWALPSKKRQRKQPTEITQVRSFES
jgi:putative copper export protein